MKNVSTFCFIFSVWFLFWRHLHWLFMIIPMFFIYFKFANVSNNMNSDFYLIMLCVKRLYCLIQWWWQQSLFADNLLLKCNFHLCCMHQNLMQQGLIVLYHLVVSSLDKDFTLGLMPYYIYKWCLDLRN